MKNEPWKGGTEEGREGGREEGRKEGRKEGTSLRMTAHVHMGNCLPNGPFGGGGGHAIIRPAMRRPVVWEPERTLV